MGGTVVKKIKNSEYLYYSYYDEGKKLALYCGLVSDTASKKKALQFELEHLKTQKKRLSQKIIQVESKITSNRH